MKFSTFDLVNITVFFSSTILGVYNGFIKTIINFAGFISSIMGAIALFPHLEAFGKNYVANELALSVLSALLAYIIALTIVSIVKFYILKFTALIRGNVVDKTLGLTIGIVRGVFFCLILFLVSMFFTSKKMVEGKEVKDFVGSLDQDNYPTWFLESETAELTIEANEFVLNALPKSILEYDLSKIGLDKWMNKATESRKKKDRLNKEEKSKTNLFRVWYVVIPRLRITHTLRSLFLVPQLN
ncbi:MAG: hypothetical protein K0Q51_1588 [Rickettsiaceae bacterium]|nr:hypothetical protein [Rickettsiaceae bacterium]